jgi:hypothetical protein
LRGTIRLPDEGRWFVYLDAHRRGKTVESWIPVKAAEGQRRFAARDRFAYIADREPATLAKWVAGIVMYCLVIAFLVAMALLVRRSRSEDGQTASADAATTRRTWQQVT